MTKKNWENRLYFPLTVWKNFTLRFSNRATYHRPVYRYWNLHHHPSKLYEYIEKRVADELNGIINRLVANSIVEQKKKKIWTWIFFANKCFVLWMRMNSRRIAYYPYLKNKYPLFNTSIIIWALDHPFTLKAYSHQAECRLDATVLRRGCTPRNNIWSRLTFHLSYLRHPFTSLKKQLTSDLRMCAIWTEIFIVISVWECWSTHSSPFLMGLW